MRTNIDIDDELLDEAMHLAGAKTKKSTIEIALKSLVQRYRVQKAGTLRGSVEWVGDLDDMRGARA